MHFFFLLIMFYVSSLSPASPLVRSSYPQSLLTGLTSHVFKVAKWKILGNKHTCRRFGFQGGAKKYSPYVYPPIFRGGPGVARCILRVTGVSRGMTGVSFFSNKQKKVRCIF